MKYLNRKGQSIVELSILGSVLLMLFGYILSNMQSLNDNQYLGMETFRRALEKANTYRGADSEGAGASVQMTAMQNRRNVDLSAEYRQGAATSVGASANVFWAVPKVGEQPESLIVYKINEDEWTWKYRDFVAKADDKTSSFRIEDTTVDADTAFAETSRKQESTSEIALTRESTLRDVITTNITYTIRQKDQDSNPDNDPIIKGPMPLFGNNPPTQWLYRDAGDGLYKYSEKAVGQEVQRGMTRATGF